MFWRAFFIFTFFISGILPAQSAIPLHSFVLTDQEVYSILVDAPHNQIFVSIAELNRIDVYSLDRHELVDRIPFPSPATMGLTDDGTRVIVGSGGRVNLYAASGTEYVSVLDAATHRVTARYAIPPIPGIDTRTRRFPDGIAVLADDVVVIRLGSYDSTLTDVIKLDLKTGVFGRVAIPFAYSAAELKRVGATSIVIADSSNSGAFGIFDVAADRIIYESAFSGYFVGGIAVSPDGSRLAVRQGWNPVHIFDSQLNDLGTVSYPNAVIEAVMFNSDGSRLYVCHDHYFDVVDTATLQNVGSIPAPSAEHGVAIAVANDPNGFILAKTEHGFYFVDATPRTLSGTAAITGDLTPTAGPLGGGTIVSFNGAAYTMPSAVYVGPLAASQAQVVNANKLQITTPPGMAPGPQDVIVDFANGWRTYSPQAFSYGPHLLYTDMNAGPANGSTKMRIVGYGFGYDASRISVTVGGQSATIDKVFAYPGISPWVLPTHSIYVTVPPGAPGNADIVVTTPDGTAILKDGFRYYPMTVATGTNATAANIVYDRWRNRILAGIPPGNLIQVFDAQTLVPITQIDTVTDPLGMSFTPDGSKLLVASGSADQLVILDAETYLASRIQLSFPFAYGRAEQVFPETVVATNNGKALVGVPDFDMLDNAYLVEVDLATGEQKRIDPFNIYLLSYLDMRQLDGGSRILFTPIGYGGDAMAIWDSASESFTETHSVTSHYDVAVTDDAEVIASGKAILNSQFRVTARALSLEYTTPVLGDAVYGLALSPGGSLLFQPHVNSLWVFDANYGTELQRISLPGTIPSALSALTLSPEGSKAYLLSDGGLLTVDLNPLPLTVGTILPAEVPNEGTTTIMVRGSGFDQSTALFVNDSPVTSQFINSTTLQVTIPALPEGSYSLTAKSLDGRNYTKLAALNVYGSEPSVSGTTPSRLDAGIGDQQILVFGRNFQQGSIVSVNGIQLQTTFNSETNLSALVPRNLLTSEGTVALTVTTPGGAPSVPFTVNVKYPPGKWNVGTTVVEFGIHRLGIAFTSNLTVGNLGRGPLFGASIQLEGTSFSQTNDCPATLMPSSFCTIHLVLIASSPGPVTDVVHLIAQDSTYDITLHATLISEGPYLQVRDYGSVLQGFLGEPVSSTIYLQAFDTPVTISRITASDPGAVVNNSCITITTSGCSFSVSFAPKVVGPSDFTVTIESDSSISPQTVNVHANGVSPMRIDVNDIVFRNVLIGSSASYWLTLWNLGGNYVAQINNVSVSGPFTVSSECGSSLASGKSCQVKVGVTATTIGSFTGELTIRTQDETFKLPIIANSVDFGIGMGLGAAPNITVNAGQKGTAPISLTAMGGFAGNVNLSCTTTVPQAACTISPLFLQLDSSGAVFPATFEITTTKRSSAQNSGPINLMSILGGVAFGCVVFRCKGKRLSRTTTLICCAVLLSVVSCGGGGGSGPGGGSSPVPSPPGTPPGTYSATVTASYNVFTPAVTRSINIAINVN